LKWEIFLPDINKSKIKHVIINECEANYDDEPHFAGECLSNHFKTKHCNNAAFIWSQGTDQVFFNFLFENKNHKIKIYYFKIQYFPNDAGF
jgi:hypothetical protein